MAQEEEKKEFPKGLKLSRKEMENLKLKELVERYNLLMMDFAKEGYVLQPFVEPGLRMVRIKKKGINLNPFNKQ